MAKVYSVIDGYWALWAYTLGPRHETVEKPINTQPSAANPSQQLLRV